MGAFLGLDWQNNFYMEEYLMKVQHILLIVLLVAVISVSTSALTVYAMKDKAVNVPNEFTSGDTLSASLMNANFDYLEGEIETNQTDITANLADITALQGLTTYFSSTATVLLPGVEGQLGAVESGACNSGDIVTGCWCGAGHGDFHLYDVQPEPATNTCECRYQNNGSTADNIEAKAICLDLP